MGPDAAARRLLPARVLLLLLLVVLVVVVAVVMVKKNGLECSVAYGTVQLYNKKITAIMSLSLSDLRMEGAAERAICKKKKIRKNNGAKSL